MQSSAFCFVFLALTSNYAWRSEIGSTGCVWKSEWHSSYVPRCTGICTEWSPATSTSCAFQCELTPIEVISDRRIKWSWRSHDKLSTYGLRAFGIAGPTMSNSHLCHLRDEKLTLEQFTSGFKINLFRVSYNLQRLKVNLRVWAGVISNVIVIYVLAYSWKTWAKIFDDEGSCEVQPKKSSALVHYLVTGSIRCSYTCGKHLCQ